LIDLASLRANKKPDVQDGCLSIKTTTLYTMLDALYPQKKTTKNASLICVHVHANAFLKSQHCVEFYAEYRRHKEDWSGWGAQ
jgi:hypothetical protein